MSVPGRKEMISAFSEMDTDVLKCRDWGHLWDYKGTDQEGQHFVCLRMCGKTKIRELDARGYPQWNRYSGGRDRYAARPGIGWSADARAAMRTVLYGGRLDQPVARPPFKSA